MAGQPNRGPTFTWVLILATAAIWIVYDFFAAFHFGTSFDDLLADVGLEPTVPVHRLRGRRLCGHLFAEMRGT